ncbi:Translation elongation factor EF-Ts (Tsf) (PDB:1EFU) [Commensalibacter communis]|uniref:translation elongation factor Ts n=1 Tax=Commensalibacter communis TaxID=2972786 RepID=UPI0022FF869D|nr:translation elongation factor Ts [Commensalibacter communis]CAI3937299.1 Translation elongation factor EF-Ts (Tsf) (PDB:1EFU) [Commensalibacter communis]
MAQITAALVKELREKTGAGMMDCKKALNETAGNVEEAIDWLRTKGLATAAKKSGRVAAEGLVGVATAGNKAAVVEINAETDFVARNEQFQQFVEDAAKVALTTGDDVEALKNATMENGKTVAENLTTLIATIGENMTIRRVRVLEVGNGVVGSYIHGALRPTVGKIAVLAALEAPAASADLEDLGRKIGMQVAAVRPIALKIEEVSSEELEREKAIFVEQARASGKPDNIIEKMIDGRIRKFYEEVVLLEQLWIHDGESRVKAVIDKSGSKLVAFERFHLGEGIEKEESDFAAEVAQAAKG